MATPAFPPLHPVLVHVPIVLIPLAALLATLALSARFRGWAWTSCLVVAVMAALGAAVSALSGDELGEADEAGDVAQANATEAANPNEPAWRETHEALGTFTAWATGIFVALGLWQRRRIATAPWAYAWTGGLWLLAIIVILTGWYGGALVWDRPA